MPSDFKAPSEGRREILRLFLDAGLQVHPEAYKTLCESKNPIAIVKSIIEKTNLLEDKPVVITSEFLQQISIEPIAHRPEFHSAKGSIEAKTEEACEDWDFADANTQFMTHGLHPYPARMIPQVAERLIRRYLLERVSSPFNQYTVLDPFCGSGTVLVESLRLGFNAIGNDINPLAVLIARTKSSPPDPSTLKQSAGQLSIDLDEIEMDQVRRVPRYVRFWFQPTSIRGLLAIKSRIEKEQNEKVKDFLKVCLSNTAYKVSLADINNHQAHPARYSREELRKKPRPDALSAFLEVLHKSIIAVDEFYRTCRPNHARVRVLREDARSLSLDKKVDLVVTSPPYGEEQNTVGYMRWAKIGLFWLDYSPSMLLEIEKKTLGGKRVRSFVPLDSQTCNNMIRQTRRRSGDRALHACSFFEDYYESLERIADVLGAGKYCCIVIGSRLLLGEKVPMDKITIEMSQSLGLSHVSTYWRNIPKKVMPTRVPEGETINQESIIILRK